VDGDGRDEIAEIGFVLNGDGTERYTLADDGIIHGDRFYIADIDPSNPGLEGYGVQQDNPSKLHEYYYDAADGTMIWKHIGAGVSDVGRGLVADIDAGDPGLEVVSTTLRRTRSPNRMPPSTRGRNSACGGTETSAASCSTIRRSKSGIRRTLGRAVASGATRIWQPMGRSTPLPTLATRPSSVTSLVIGGRRW
jgi:hypothetical protein